MKAVMVEVYGSTVIVELLDKFSELDDNARYVGTDFDADVDIYEEENGELVAVNSHAAYEERWKEI